MMHAHLSTSGVIEKFNLSIEITGFFKFYFQELECFGL